MMEQYIVLLSLLLWAGCIVAISFMESWLKFKAPGVTLRIGLSIGKLVFSALNKMEWFFAAVALFGYLFLLQAEGAFAIVLFLVAGGLLALQTFWLLPALNARAVNVINGNTPPPSRLHWFFVGAEICKLSVLIFLGYALLNEFTATGGTLSFTKIVFGVNPLLLT